MDKLQFKKIAGITLAALVITVATLGSGLTANAQTPAPTQVAPATPDAQKGPQGPEGRDGRRMGPVFEVARALISETATATGLTEADVLKALFDGKTLNDIIKEKNGDPAAVQAAAKADLTAEIAKAVTAGTITQAQADKMTAALDDVLTKAMNGEFRGQFNQGRQPPQGAGLMRLGGIRVLIAETAKEASITERDLLTELRAGKTLAQIATDHKADPAAIVTAAVTQETERINKAVTDGKLKKEDADKLIAALQDEFTKLMNAKNPMMGGRGGRPGFGGRGNGPGNGPGKPPQPPGQPGAAPTMEATPSL